ncbi:MAG: ABC-F family ATP-binding cassette domain-containing protein [Actinobacteria bacterium]|nr:ABC-F family ATP-binding cassette domain-containing protein [Actinomycetota bacterium]
MSASLRAHDLTKSFGSTSVLHGVSLVVNPGDRLAVIGPNGIGKSTLLRVLAGLESPDEGRVDVNPPSARVGFVPQRLEASSDESVRDLLARTTRVAAAVAQFERAAARLAENDGGADDDYDAALQEFLAVGAADFDQRLEGVLHEVGLEASPERPLRSLSGGQAGRVRIASLLLSRFDIVLLDEPTNDLDFDGIARVEQFVDEFDGALVCVSHDRAFLERIATGVLEFEAETGMPTQHAVGFAEHERLRTRELERAHDAFRQGAHERERFTALLHQSRNKARSGARLTNRRATRAQESQTRAARRRLEQLERIEKPWEPWQLRIEFPPPPRLGDLAMALRGAVVSRGEFQLGPVDLELASGDRVVIEGANGTGKTTMLEALLGRLPLARGERVVSRSAVVGELDQTRSTLDADEPLSRSFPLASGLDPTAARTLLGQFALGGDDVERPLRALSPGEQTRANLAVLMARGTNVLILDEPTNHLDFEAIKELEGALRRYPGTAVLVTHDRRLLRGFKATRRLELAGGRLSRA